MRTLVIKIKEYYDKGIYSMEDIQRLLDAGKITQEEYKFIVG